MRIRADEHVSPAIVRMLCALAVSPGFDLTSIYETSQRGTKDEYWATEFAREGGCAILSADTDFFKKPNQIVAIDRTGLRVIHLPSKWANSVAQLQAAHILMWWRRVESTLSVARPREVWTVKWNISEEGKLERIKVDYAAAHKKLRKSGRKSK